MFTHNNTVFYTPLAYGLSQIFTRPPIVLMTVLNTAVICQCVIDALRNNCFSRVRENGAWDRPASKAASKILPTPHRRPNNGRHLVEHIQRAWGATLPEYIYSRSHAWRLTRHFWCAFINIFFASSSSPHRLWIWKSCYFYFSWD